MHVRLKPITSSLYDIYRSCYIYISAHFLLFVYVYIIHSVVLICGSRCYWRSVCLSVCLAVCLSVSVCLFGCLSLCLCLSVWLSVSLSVCLSVFPRYKAHGVALISVFLALSQTPAYTVETMNTRLVHYAACLFTLLLLLILIAPTHRGMARLSWHSCLVTYWDGSPIWRQSPIQILTGHDVDQLCWLRPMHYHWAKLSPKLHIIL